MLCQRLAEQIDLLNHFLPVVLLRSVNTSLDVRSKILDSVVEDVMLLHVRLHDALLASKLLDLREEAFLL